MNNKDVQGRGATGTNVNNTIRNNREARPDNRNTNRFEGRPEYKNDSRDPNANPNKSGFQRNWKDRKDNSQRNNPTRDQRDTRGDKSWNNNPFIVSKRIKTEETIDDIRADLARIEKEIELEIKQIASMRLGL